MFLLCPRTHTQKHHPPRIRTLILFDCVILGTCGRVREAVSCSCLKGSMWRVRHINHKGTRKEQEKKDWSVKWVAERLYCQKLPSVCHCCCLTRWRHLQTKLALHYYLSRLRVTNHITEALLNKYMQMIVGVQILPKDISM